MLPLLRAVIVWTALLATVILPRLDPAQAPTAKVAVTQKSAYVRQSVLGQTRDLRQKAAEDDQVQAWVSALQQGMAQYEAQLQVLAAAKAEAARYAALSNHPPPPPY